MSFWCLPFPPKNKRKPVDRRFYSSKVESIHLLFGGNVYLKKIVSTFLTFSGLATQQRSFLYRAKCLLLVFAIAYDQEMMITQTLIFLYTYLYILYLRHYNPELYLLIFSIHFSEGHLFSQSIKIKVGL